MKGMSSDTDSGINDSLKMNPNQKAKFNDSPDGPYASLHGMHGDGGSKGNTTVSGKDGMKFHFQK